MLFHSYTMQNIIFLHASLGAIALIFGMIAIITKKGSPLHKKSGKVFFYAMLSSAIVALFVALMPGHTSYFLFIIGIFSCYLLLSGYRALRFKNIQEISSFTTDKIISYGMLFSGLGMVIWSLLPLLQRHNPSIVLLIFGAIGITLSIRDIRLLKDTEQLTKSWLRIHIGNMVGGYMAAFTAFIVVNKFIPGIYGWLAPTVIGSIYISYWMAKIAPKKKA